MPSVTINDGNGGANYAVTLQNFTTGTIGTLPVTVAAVTASKTYDGTTAAAGTPTVTPSLATGDTATILADATNGTLYYDLDASSTELLGRLQELQRVYKLQM